MRHVPAEKKTVFPFRFNKERVIGANPSICSICYMHVIVSFFFFPQINKINLTASPQKKKKKGKKERKEKKKRKRMKGAPLWTAVSVEMPYTGWCSEISMKQHQRKQRDSSGLHKGPHELSKCLRSHYWQHFFALQVFTWWPYGFHWSKDTDFLSSEMAWTEWKTQSLKGKLCTTDIIRKAAWEETSGHLMS